MVLLWIWYVHNGQSRLLLNWMSMSGNVWLNRHPVRRFDIWQVPEWLSRYREIGVLDGFNGGSGLFALFWWGQNDFDEP